MLTESRSTICKQATQARSRECRCSFIFGKVAGKDVGDDVYTSIALLASRRSFSTALSTFVQTWSSSSAPDDGVCFKGIGLKKRVILDGVSKLKVQIWIRDNSWSSVIKVVTRDGKCKNFAHHFLQTSPRPSSSSPPT